MAIGFSVSGVARRAKFLPRMAYFWGGAGDGARWRHVSVRTWIAGDGGAGGPDSSG